MVAFFLSMYMVLSYRFWYVLFHVQSNFDDVSLLNGSQTSVVADENFTRYFFMSKMIVIDFCVSRGSFPCMHAASLDQAEPSLHITSPMNGILVCLKWHFFLFSYCILSGISASPVSVFCHDPWHQYHTLQLGCHLLCQMHMAGLGILC